MFGLLLTPSNKYKTGSDILYQISVKIALLIRTVAVTMAPIIFILFSSFFTIISSRSNTCVTSSGPAAGQPCVFPFTQNGVTHHTCAEQIGGGQPAGTRWCSTKTDSAGNHVGQVNYGFCPDTCSSTGTSPQGKGVYSKNSKTLKFGSHLHE